MGYPDSFEGYAVKDKKHWSDFHRMSYKPKRFEDYDCDIEITHCGICASDLHTINAGWGEPDYPQVVGHEIVGKVLKVGPKVKTINVGDRVGVGAQIWACLECRICKNDNENYCPHLVDTYNANYQNGDKAWGGYASHVRAHEQFVFPIPDAIPSNLAAPMFCAGLTVYSPMVRHGCGPGKKVAVVGIGGLGHFALMFGKALGAEMTAISHSPSKAADAKKMGATQVIDSSKKDFAKDHALEFDLIISTTDAGQKDFPMADYLSMLNVNGTFNQCGLPNEPLPAIKGMVFASNGCHLGGSHIGNKKECLAMLNLVAKHGIKSWIEEIPISAEGCKEGLTRLDKNDVSYRFVLTGIKEHFSK